MAEMGSPLGIKTIAEHNSDFLAKYNHEGLTPIHTMIQACPAYEEIPTTLYARYKYALDMFLFTLAKDQEVAQRPTESGISPLLMAVHLNQPDLVTMLMNTGKVNPDPKTGV